MPWMDVCWTAGNFVCRWPAMEDQLHRIVAVAADATEGKLLSHNLLYSHLPNTFFNEKFMNGKWLICLFLWKKKISKDHVLIPVVAVVAATEGVQGRGHARAPVVAVAAATGIANAAIVAQDHALTARARAAGRALAASQPIEREISVPSRGEFS